ncbi:MAG: transcription elongation factor GreA [Patescibacteria group bacterium]
MVDKIQYMSPEGLEKLKVELQDLKTVRRKEAVVRIETAKALGDLSENADYHEAKNELAFIDGRMQEIQQMLKNVSIIEQDGGTSSVRIGSTIEVESRGIKKTFRIVGSNEADPAQGLISNESPLGSAFLGHAVGDQVEVETPAGGQTYTIVSVA